MSYPNQFTIMRVSASQNDLHGWHAHSVEVEALWLPTIGPTAFCALRMLDDECTLHGVLVELEIGDSAARLGVGPGYLWHALGRLERARMIWRDVDEWTHEKPAYLMGYRVPKIDPRHVRRLPASTRALWAGVY